MNVSKQKQSCVGGSLPTYWQSRCHDLFEDCQKPLTLKERGQLKQLGKYLLDDTKKTIDWALTNWWKFTHEAAVQAGLATFPTVPTEQGGIGFLLKYCAVAVNLMQKQSKVQESAKAEPVHMPVMPMPVAEKPKKMTVEEFEQILAEFSVEEEMG